jgi:hypothetical protein
MNSYGPYGHYGTGYNTMPKAKITESGKYIAPSRGDKSRPGTRQTAVIVDMDGTIDDLGRPNAFGMSYCRQMHKAGHVIIIVTARTHSIDYERTHRWLIRNMQDLPFVGPICRAKDDMRFACDFKRAVYQSLSGVYEIIGAIDDDRHVLQMWRSIAGLEVVEAKPAFPVTRGDRKPNWWSNHYSVGKPPQPLSGDIFASHVDDDSTEYWDVTPTDQDSVVTEYAEVCRAHRDPDCDLCDVKDDDLWAHPNDLDEEEELAALRSIGFCSIGDCTEQEWEPGTEICALHWDEFSGKDPEEVCEND